MNSRRSNFICVALIVAAGLCAFCNSLRGPFVFDDYPAIVENPEIQTLAGAIWPTSEFTAGRSVAVITLYLNYVVGGRAPLGYHVVNVAIHLLTAVVLFALVRRTLLAPRVAAKWARYSTPIALVSALLFVTHPLTTEVANYILQRNESLMTLMTLLTLYFLNRAMSSNHRRIFSALAVAACAIGMGSKQVMVVAPLIAYAYDRVFFCDTWIEPLRRRWPVFIALGATWSVFIASQLGRRHYQSVGIFIGGVTPWTYLLSQSTVLVHYLQLAFWPHPLVVDYFGWPLARSIREIWPYGLLIVSLLTVSAWALFRGRPGGFAGMAIFLALAPTSSLLPLPSEFAAERRMYLPLAFGLPLVAATALSMLRRAVGPSAAAIGAVAAGCAVVLLGATTIDRNSDYATDETLWADAVSKRPGDGRAWANYAAVLYHENRFKDAAIADKAAIDLSPEFPPPHENLGAIYARDGDYANAIREFRASIRSQDGPKARALLANAYVQIGRDEEAIAEFQRAIAMSPTDPALHDARGFVLAKMGRTREAAGEFAAAIRIDPRMTGAYFDLALAEEAEGDWAAAVKNLRMAMTLDPDKPLVFRALAWALAVTPDEKVANAEEAVKFAEKAAAAKKDDAEFADTLGAAYARSGRFDEAIAAANRAGDMAEKEHRPALAAAARARGAMYQKKQPFIQPRPRTGTTTKASVS